jgi:hypothetical protein
MAQSCTVCNSPHKAEIEAQLGFGATLATVSALFGVTKSAAGRHKRDHMARVEVKPNGEHLQAADAMIEQARASRTFDSYDEAEAVYLRTIAVALDAKPENPSILAEFRRTLASFRPVKPQESAPDAQLELAQLIAACSAPPPDAWQRAYNAAIAAGVDPWDANNVASAATDPSYDPAHPPIKYKRMVAGVEMDD